MPPLRVHYLAAPEFEGLICGTAYDDFDNLQTTQEGSRVDCRRCLRYIEPYRADPAALAAYGAGFAAGYNAGYNQGFADALDDEDEDYDEDDWR